MALPEAALLVAPEAMSTFESMLGADSVGLGNTLDGAMGKTRSLFHKFAQEAGLNEAQTAHLGSKLEDNGMFGMLGTVQPKR